MSAPTPASAPPPAPQGGPRFEVNEQLETAGAMFRAHLLKCLPLAMVAVLATSAADLYLRVTGQAPITPAAKGTTIKLPDDPMFWAIDVAGTLLSILLTSTMIIRLRALHAGGQPTVAENLRAAAARWLPAVATTILAVLVIAMGLMLLIVPGIYLAICAVVLLPVVLLEPIEPSQALLRCFRLVKPQWVKVFACMLISLLIGIICLVALAGILGLLFGAVLDNHLAEAVLQAIVLAGLATFYVFIAALSLTIYTTLSSHTAASSSA
jgi:hypothetical protein